MPFISRFQTRLKRFGDFFCRYSEIRSIALLPQLTLEFFCLPGCRNTSSEILEICAYSCGFLPRLSTAVRCIKSSRVIVNVKNNLTFTIKTYLNCLAHPFAVRTTCGSANSKRQKFLAFYNWGSNNKNKQRSITERCLFLYNSLSK